MTRRGSTHVSYQGTPTDLGERRPRGPGSLTGIRPEGETRINCLRVHRALLPLLVVALLLGGCGGGDSSREDPQPGVGTSLDADNLALVHDELYACLRRELPDVLLANYLGGQASITNTLAQSSF